MLCKSCRYNRAGGYVWHLQALFNLGNLQRQCGDFESAIAKYETVLELAPDHWRGLLNYAVALNGVGREADAKAALRRAFQLSGKCFSEHACTRVLCRIWF